MKLDDPDFDPGTSKSNTLALVLHGFSWPQTLKDAWKFVLQGFSWSNESNIEGLVGTVRAEYGAQGVDVYAPRMPYTKILDSTGANAIVVALVKKLDEIWNQKPGGYERVILVGHSMGGVLLRRVFLCGAPRPPDYSGEFAARDDLATRAPGNADGGGWAGKVERLVLIAAWDKGWSISQRDGWWYSAALNLLGFLGHISPGDTDSTGVIRKLLIAGTAFDLRRGAAFIVQTRLLWLAYRRWHNKAHNEKSLDRQQDEAPRGADPLVVQIIGVNDDFISPKDQVDNEVNGALPNDPRPRYFLLEMADTKHADAIDFSGKHGPTRERIVRAALRDGSFAIGPGNAADGRVNAVDPRLYDDDAPMPDLEVKHVAFVIHGIRDDGFWTHSIARTIAETAKKYDPAGKAKLHCVTATYGYFAMLPFILPWVRRQKAEWFQDKYVSAKVRFPNARFHYVGHSNGTYLAARALQDCAAIRFQNVYFAGSVVRSDYNWSALAPQRVEHFHNVRGATDWVIAGGPKSVDFVSEDLGAGGFDGFLGAQRAGEGPVTESKGSAWGGHSGAITERHWPGIAEFIVTGRRPPEPPDLFSDKPLWWLDWLTRPRFIGLPLGGLIVSTFVVWLMGALFGCGGAVSYFVPILNLAALAACAVLVLTLCPNRPPGVNLSFVLRIATIIGAVSMLLWFIWMFVVLLVECGYALHAIVLLGALAFLRFLATEF